MIQLSSITKRYVRSQQLQQGDKMKKLVHKVLNFGHHLQKKNNQELERMLMLKDTLINAVINY